jgi:hypothetical protein
MKYDEEAYPDCREVLSVFNEKRAFMKHWNRNNKIISLYLLVS